MGTLPHRGNRPLKSRKCNKGVPILRDFFIMLKIKKTDGPNTVTDKKVFKDWATCSVSPATVTRSNS